MTTYQGLTTQQAQELVAQGKANVSSAKTSQSVASIVASNVFTYFNAIFLFLSVILVAVGSFKSLTFMPVVVANTVIGIVQQIRSKRVLDQLALLDVSEYEAIRDGAAVTVPSDQLVLGDLIRLASGQQIPADAVVVVGEASVNESLLTGEADEIEKTTGSELRSGSFVVAGELVARLTRVGDDSYASQLTAQAKEVKDRQSEMVHDIEIIVRTAGVLILPIGGLLYYQAAVLNHATPQAAVTSMVGAVIGMIPEGLYLLVTIALALSAARLAKRMVLLHDMRSIETLARTDVLCVDKTGTITGDTMSVQEVFPAWGVTGDAFLQAQEDVARYVRTATDSNSTMEALREHFPTLDAFVGAEVTPFSSKLKYSQVVAADKTMRLGAPEYVLDEETLAANQTLIKARTAQGRRVLVFAMDERTAGGAGGNAADEADGADESNKLGDRDGGASRRSVTPLLFIALHNDIRDGARDTFAGFAQCGVEIKVISGDNPVTVSKVAKDAGIAHADRYVDATSLDTPDKIASAVGVYTVFGRVQPEQKKELVEALKAKGLRVAMTGDGVNDILAMKEADCSIAMGSGSDAARQAAQVVLLDSDFSHMNEIVSEGRRDINNITRSATLFLYKNIFSLSLALFTIFGSFVYPLTPNQVSLISMFNIGLPAFLLAFEPNEERQHGRFVVEVLLRSLPAALTSFAAIGTMILFADLFGISHEDVATASTYLLSVVGFLILAGITRPLNRYRTMVFAVCIAGLIGGCGFFYQLFDIYRLSLKGWVLCVVFAFAEVGVLRILSGLLDFVRARLSLRFG